jgi:hypothetical protein
MHDFFNKAGEGACLGTRRSPSREHRPEIDRRQFPVFEHRLDGSISKLGREHPFRSDGDAGTREHRCSNTLSRGDPQAPIHRYRPLGAVALEGP